MANSITKAPSKHIDIILTDLRFHVTKPRNPQSLIRQAEKAIRSGKPGRAYTSEIIKPDNEIAFLIDSDPTVIEAKKRATRENKTVRFFIPKAGLSIYLGDDAKEFVKAHYPEMAKKFLTK